MYVGLVEQNRYNQGGNVWNAPRGFLDPGETHFDAAIRELSEETGYIPSPTNRVRYLDGNPLNPNSTFFDTSKKGEGVRFYAIEVMTDEIDIDNLCFKSEVLKPMTKTAELITRCKFFPWRKATQVGDMFTVASIARLLAIRLIK